MTMRKPGSPFLDSIYEEMLTERYAMVTINAYLHWIKFFICYNQLRHPLSARKYLGKVRISHQVQKYAFVSIWIKSTKIFSFVVEGTCSHLP